VSIHVSISRRAEPLDEGGPKISSDDWIQVISGEPDFRRPEGAEREWGGPFARVWVGHPQGPVSFDWLDGDVDVRNPDQTTVARMKTLAMTLKATVFSETGEVFDDDGESPGFLDGYP